MYIHACGYSHTCTEAIVYSTQAHGNPHVDTHIKRIKYWLKGQGELYLHKQVGESRPPQMKRGDIINKRSS